MPWQSQKCVWKSRAPGRKLPADGSCTPTPSNPPGWLMGHYTPIKKLSSWYSVSKDGSATEMGGLANKADINFFIWMEFCHHWRNFGTSPKSCPNWEWGRTADKSVWIFARWKKMAIKKGMCNSRRGLKWPGRVWGPSSDPVEIKEFSSDIFMTQHVLDWPWAFPKNDLLKGFSSTPLAPVRGQTQQCLNLSDPFLNLWWGELRFFLSPWTSIKEGKTWQ